MMQIPDDETNTELRHATFEHYRSLPSALRQTIASLGNAIAPAFQNPGLELDLAELHAEYMGRRQRILDAVQADLAAEDKVFTAILHQWLVPLSEGRSIDTIDTPTILSLLQPKTQAKEHARAISEPVPMRPRSKAVQSTGRVDEGDWEHALEVIEEALASLDDLPERAEDFRESVRDKLESICDWVAEHESITGAQATAVNNMIAGIERWLEH